jgi:hypothetical protein
LGHHDAGFEAALIKQSRPSFANRDDRCFEKKHLLEILENK